MITLKLTDPHMRGPAVRRVQELCDLFGFDTGANDGVYDPRTAEAVRLLQMELQLKPDGIYGPVTHRAAAEALAGKFKGKQDAAAALRIVVDITGTHPRPKNYSHQRRWNTIDGVTLHQTGCAMPNNPLGWGRVNAHYGLTREGVAILINDPLDMIWHAQGLSPSTIGVEIAGNYPGVLDRPETLWSGGGGPHNLTPEMIEGAERIRADIAERFELAGQPWAYLYAHRQSSATRRADPGEEIWRTIARPWCALSGCVPHPNYRRGTGRGLPEEWSPGEYEGVY